MSSGKTKQNIASECKSSFTTWINDVLSDGCGLRLHLAQDEIEPAGQSYLFITSWSFHTLLGWIRQTRSLLSWSYILEDEDKWKRSEQINKQENSPEP